MKQPGGRFVLGPAGKKMRPPGRTTGKFDFTGIGVDTRQAQPGGLP
jgi:hypothetical protein